MKAEQERYTAEELKERLRNGVITVKFQKANGEDRVMACTLKEETIERYGAQPSGKGKKENEQVLPVFDVEKGEWRSFRIDSVNWVG